MAMERSDFELPDAKQQAEDASITASDMMQSVTFHADQPKEAEFASVPRKSVTFADDSTLSDVKLHVHPASPKPQPPIRSSISQTFFSGTPNEYELLKAAMNADINKAKELLISAKGHGLKLDFILEESKGTERCGRKWQAISPLQFTAWAGDTEMLRLFICHLPKECAAKTLAQLRAVHDALEHGSCMAPYQALIKAYDTYSKDFFELRDQQQFDALDQRWIQLIGGAQRMLPMVGLQELCDPQPFNPRPNFNTPPKRTIQFSDDKPLIFDELGFKNAIYHGGGGKLREARNKVTDHDLADPRVFVDQQTLIRLCSRRKNELAAIIVIVEKKLEKFMRPKPVVEAERFGGCCVMQ